MKKKEKRQKIPRTEQQMAEGIQYVLLHPFFGRLDHYGFRLKHQKSMPKDAAVIVYSDGEIFFNAKADYQPEQWAWAVAHAMLHRAFGHFDLDTVPGYEKTDRDGTVVKVADFDPEIWNIACDLYINQFLADIHFGRPLRVDGGIQVPRSVMADEISIYDYLMERKERIADHFAGTASPGTTDMERLFHPIVYDPQAPAWVRRSCNTYAKEFALALSSSVSRAVSIAGGYRDSDREKSTDAQKAAAWFLNHYPLLGGMASAFCIVEDLLLCQKNDIRIAAVDAEQGEIYINPACGLSMEELKFVLAHEFLHAGLQHHKRQQGRDPYLWNVACDFVINGWLQEMQVGRMPDGVLFDPQFRNVSAEEIYDRIIVEARRFRKQDTFRGYGKGDVLSGGGRIRQQEGISLDDFFRNALLAGLEYHMDRGRGHIPAGMVQEIRALAMPPIRWDVELANWFDENIRPAEKHRSFARPSRRQGATPDIPRPGHIWGEESRRTAVFGVVIDTSGSMSAEDIGKALGSVVSFAAAKDVRYVRVIFCDADAYDAGYLDIDTIAGRVRVIGRGGTRLQPAIDLLEEADDFPADAPILIITDGWIESHMDIRHKHAFLIPAGRSLPFRPRGEVFYFT